MKEALLSKFHDRTARIGIIGQGYVGLPLALLFHEAGFQVTGFDVDPRKVESLRKGESFIRHIGAERVAAAVRSGRYNATADFDGLRECDAIAICVPTPLGAHREPDNSYIHATGREIAKRLRPGQLVLLESTTYPGTTDEELLPILEKRRGYDAVVVSTAHEVFKERALFEGLPLVVDTRNLVAGLFPDGGGPRRVVKA